MSANDIDEEMGGNCGNIQESEAIVVSNFTLCCQTPRDTTRDWSLFTAVLVPRQHSFQTLSIRIYRQ